MAIDGGIDAERKNVLVVSSEYSGMDDGAPRDFHVRWLCADDPRCSDFVLHLASLVEYEGHDVLVISNSDDGLYHELSTTDNGGRTGSIIGVFPPNASVLLVNTNHVLHGPGITFICVEHGTEVMNGPKTVTSKLKIIGHDTCAGIAEVECCLLMERVPRVGIGDDHV